MNKQEKRKQRLIERISELEINLRESLQRKVSATKEVNVASLLSEINNLKIELGKMK